MMIWAVSFAPKESTLDEHGESGRENAQNYENRIKKCTRRTNFACFTFFFSFFLYFALSGVQIFLPLLVLFFCCHYSFSFQFLLFFSVGGGVWSNACFALNVNIFSHFYLLHMRAWRSFNNTGCSFFTSSFFRQLFLALSSPLCVQIVLRGRKVRGWGWRWRWRFGFYGLPCLSNDFAFFLITPSPHRHRHHHQQQQHHHSELFGKAFLLGWYLPLLADGTVKP